MALLVRCLTVVLSPGTSHLALVFVVSTGANSKVWREGRALVCAHALSLPVSLSASFFLSFLSSL